MAETMLKNCIGEFIGTFLLIFTVGNNVLTGGGPFAVLSIASVLMVSIYALGSVCGANFNPAVSVALLMNGNMDATKCGAYVVTQLIAGAAAGALCGALHGDTINVAPAAPYTWQGAGLIEFLYTFMLVFTVLRAAVSDSNPKNNEYFGLAIGFSVVAGGYAGGFISGGCFNPAVAFGLDISSVTKGFGHCLTYWAFELAGAAAAVAVHKVVDPNAEKTGAQKALSEFLGTFFLVFTVGLIVVQGPDQKAGALSIGASLLVMIYALGGVSGAHFNPAVTTALVLTKKEKAENVPLYMASQLLGGIVAGVAFTNLTGKTAPLGPVGDYSMGAAAVAEIVYTFLLCFVVLNVAALSGDKELGNGGKAKQIYGLAIGFCIVVAGNAIGGVSGGSLNPAVSFGLDTSNALKGGSWMNCLPYSAFELTGAAVAAGAFYVLRDEEFTKAGFLDEKVKYGAA